MTSSRPQATMEDDELTAIKKRILESDNLTSIQKVGLIYPDVLPKIPDDNADAEIQKIREEAIGLLALLWVRWAWKQIECRGTTNSCYLASLMETRCGETGQVTVMTNTVLQAVDKDDANKKLEKLDKKLDVIHGNFDLFEKNLPDEMCDSDDWDGEFEDLEEYARIHNLCQDDSD